jgi:hypothetical protein
LRPFALFNEFLLIKKKMKRTHVPLTSSHGPQNFCHLFSSKNTTRGQRSS